MSSKITSSSSMVAPCQTPEGKCNTLPGPASRGSSPINAPATFGKIRAARDMRRIQLGARLSF